MPRSRSTFDSSREQHSEGFGANCSSIIEEEGFRYGPRRNRFRESQTRQDNAIHEAHDHSPTQVGPSSYTHPIVSDSFPAGKFWRPSNDRSWASPPPLQLNKVYHQPPLSTRLPHPHPFRPHQLPALPPPNPLLLPSNLLNPLLFHLLPARRLPLHLYKCKCKYRYNNPPVFP